jgi:NAD(P)-dependent dehydrogenase (short-subunit alcohol dehydrogenase family)
MGDRLRNQVAIVTGGASGIGRATAVRFAEEGADVLVADVGVAGGEETARDVRATGRKAWFVQTDVTDPGSVQQMVMACIEHFGAVDILMAAAGIARAPGARPSEPVIDLPLAHWQRVLDVNLTGIYLTNQAVARWIVAAGRPGKIVNVASGAAKWPIPGNAAYSVSKAGVWMLTKVLAAELARSRIRVNAIGPGVIDTPMTAEIQEDEARLAATLRRIPLGRLGEPRDIANTALFLASDESDYFTGEILHPSGGWYFG